MRSYLYYNAFMKVLVFGKNSKELEYFVKQSGLDLVKENPEVVISFGGDGTLLSAERLYPQIPKLPIRETKFCKKCSKHADTDILKKLAHNKLKLTEVRKLETTVLYRSFFALNDFVIRNSNPTHTIRFKTSVSGDQLLIGDGIVLATPFGSTGYFKSITQKDFTKGIGVAFNNTTKKIAPVFLTENDTVSFDLKRGKATLSFDNSPDIFKLDEGSQLQFKLSEKVAQIYLDTSLRCPNCKAIRD